MLVFERVDTDPRAIDCILELGEQRLGRGSLCSSVLDCYYGYCIRVMRKYTDSCVVLSRLVENEIKVCYSAVAAVELQLISLYR